MRTLVLLALVLAALALLLARRGGEAGDRWQRPPFVPRRPPAPGARRKAPRRPVAADSPADGGGDPRGRDR